MVLLDLKTTVFWFVCGLKDLFIHLMGHLAHGKPVIWKTFPDNMA